MYEFNEGQMVRVVSLDGSGADFSDAKYVGMVGQIVEKRDVPAHMRISGALAIGRDIGYYIYAVKFPGIEAQYCGRKGCVEPHYPLFVWFQLSIVDDPDEAPREETNEENLDEELTA